MNWIISLIIGYFLGSLSFVLLAVFMFKRKIKKSKKNVDLRKVKLK